MYTLPLESLDVGQTIGAVFKDPDEGWVGLTLVTENGDFVLRVVVYGRGVGTVILYASRDGNQENLEIIDDFPYGTTARTVVGVEVGEEGLSILSANGEYVTSFPYQGSLTYDKVKAIEWSANEDAMTVLRQISISFPRQ